MSLKQTNYNDLEEKDVFYYELSSDDLKQFGIDKAEDTYIVNYKTGEVFNTSEKTTGDGSPLYLDY